MSLIEIKGYLSEESYQIVNKVYDKACLISGHTPRFSFFTLHDKSHLDSLYRIFGIFLEAGLKLTDRQVYLLALAIAIHDLGMVSKLAKHDAEDLLKFNANALDPANFERTIREQHHELISSYIEQDLGFLSDLGISIPDIAIVTEISRAHRVVQLRELSGDTLLLGALIRLIDELDIGSGRSPVGVFKNLEPEMDDVSRWHWFKHIITEEWHINHNVERREIDGIIHLTFKVTVHPTCPQSLEYWLTQVERPIKKVLFDDEVFDILQRHSNLSIKVSKGRQESKPNKLDDYWREIEEKAMTSGREVILVIDDEITRLKDLYLPLSSEYHVNLVPYVKAGIAYLKAVSVSLVVLDLQMPAQDLWSAESTEDYAFTGLALLSMIKKDFPDVKTCILTGIRHPIQNVDSIDCDIFLRKPIDPYELKEKITNLIKG